MEFKVNKLTPYQKMQALHDRFYANMKWSPKKGDYYTTSRNDLELYYILDEDEEFFYTVYTTDKTLTTSKWKKETFTSEGFGPCRVYVHGYIIGTDPYFTHLPNGVIAPYEKESKWISIKDRMPEFISLVLIWTNISVRPTLGYWANEWMYFSVDGNFWLRDQPHIEVTHWQPLPEKP